MTAAITTCVSFAGRLIAHWDLLIPIPRHGPSLRCQFVAPQTRRHIEPAFRDATSEFFNCVCLPLNFRPQMERTRQTLLSERRRKKRAQSFVPRLALALARPPAVDRHTDDVVSSPATVLFWPPSPLSPPPPPRQSTWTLTGRPS